MRIIIKIGTNVLIAKEGQFNFAQMEKLIRQMVVLKQKGHEIILVSSGAIGLGRQKLPSLLGDASKPVWAAIGQPELLRIYQKLFGEFDIMVAQCLLLRNDFTDRERYDNFIRTISGLLLAKVVPIINENDVMAKEDLTVGDNDLLAAMTAIALQADMLIILTIQRGLFTSDPDTHAQAKIIPVVEDVGKELEKLCSAATSSLGRGGMLSKIRAAKHAVYAGITVYIADGHRENAITDLASGKNIGTKFPAKRREAVSDQKRWLMSAKGFGEIVIDEGAQAALKNGKSLLFPGIIRVKGIFDQGEIVEVISRSGYPVAYGKVNYNYLDLQNAIGRSKSQIPATANFKKEVIHRDYMVNLS